MIFILINKRFRNGIQSAKTYPNADAGKIKKIKLRTLQDETCQQQINEIIAEKCHEDTTKDIDSAWNDMKTVVLDVGKEFAGSESQMAKKPWTTQEILALIDKIRKYKNKDKEKYKQIQNEIKNAMEHRMEKKCRETEELNYKHHTFIGN